MDKVVMETNFILLVIFIMIAIFWFVNMSEIKMGRHKKAYGMGVLFIICACVSRIFCVYVDFKNDVFSIGTISLAHMVYLSSLMVAYASYGYLTMCLLNYNARWEKGLLYWYFAPSILAVLLVVCSRYTGWIYTVNEEHMYVHGPIHAVISLIPIYYITPGLFNLMKKRKYLPPNLIKCTMITIFGYVVGLVMYTVSGSKPLLIAVISVILMIQLFAVVFFDSFWDEESTMLNQDAFDFYIKRYLSRNKSMDVILLQIAGFRYLKESKDSELLSRFLEEFSADLKSMIKVNTTYYWGNGIYAIAIDEDEKKVDEDQFLKKLLHYCNHPTSEIVRQLSPEIDISYIRVPEDVNNPKVLYSYVNMERDTIEVREEKVRFREKNELSLKDAYRVDKVLAAMKTAIRNQSFQMYYQPIYNVAEKRFSSAEALIRLTDAEIGMIPPDEFIPLAEKHGYIMEIGAQVLEKVCHFMDESQITDYGVDYIEVNVSIGQFLDESLPHKLESILKKNHLNFQQINLEITETATPFEENKMRAQLKKMSDMGFLFSLDDYGTGYSNMEAVTEYPLEIIKLDKSIVWSAFENKKAMITMESLVALFHKMGFRIVAEGVETEDMLRKLEEMKVDYIQGYYFSKPLPQADYLAFLKNVLLKSEQ